MHKRSSYFDYSQNPGELCINPYEQSMHSKLHKATQMKSQNDANSEPFTVKEPFVQLKQKEPKNQKNNNVYLS